LSRAVPFVAALATVVSAAPARAAELGERTLERGDRGDDVRALQDVLNELDLKTDTDGLFGSGTASRVKTYERREDLAVDGRVSPGQARGMERRAAGSGDDTLRPGDRADSDQAPGTPADGTPADGTPADGTGRPDETGSATGASGTFPVDGAHRFGDGFGSRGGGHKGQDVMADCGTPLRAVADVTVRKVATEAAAGRYIVLHDGDSGGDYVYMHMSSVSVATGDTVSAGDKVGAVGQTGDATACHVHFEEWTAPGWYAGGQAKDPAPFLHSLEGS
jgi:murein DD-endopeptidase MepM/ murein hydrolase activator NlpD